MHIGQLVLEFEIGVLLGIKFIPPIFERTRQENIAEEIRKKGTGVVGDH